MSDEKTKAFDEEAKPVVEEKKGNWFGRQWSKIVTGATCLAVGVGITLGADAIRVKETVDKAVANRAVLVSATQAAETAVNALTESSQELVSGENKVAAIAKAVEAGVNAGNALLEVKDAVSEVVNDLSENVKEIKEAVENKDGAAIDPVPATNP